MKAEFEFHPVGQGLFYTGMIENGGSSFNFVYDCGGSKTLVNDAVKSYLKKIGNRPIDLIVFLHLHEDHINGVFELLESTNKKSRVVIPFSNRTMNMVYEYQYEKDHGDIATIREFYKNPISIIRDITDCQIIQVESLIKI